MRIFIDECLSPALARMLNADGGHDAVHPRDRGRLGEADRVIFLRCIAEDRIVVTENADDFRKLAASVSLHPGVIVLPSVKRDLALGLLQAAVAFVESCNPARPQDVLVNRVLTVSPEGAMAIATLP